MRGHLQSLVFGKTKLPDKSFAKSLIFQDLAELVLPTSTLIDPENTNVEAPHDDRFQIAQKMEHFAKDVSEPYYDLLRTLNMNRSRTRRMLCHTILDWDVLQLDLEDLDVELRRFTHEQPVVDGGSGESLWAFPLSSWAHYLKLRQMEWIVQLGAELGVYQTTELVGVYWYLRYLADVRLKHLQRIYGFLDVRGDSAAFQHSAAIARFSMIEASATACLAEALSLLYQACVHLSLLPSIPPDAYSSDELRHQLRLRPFLSLCHPPVPPPDMFPSATPPTLEPAALRESVLAKLDRVDASARTARVAWDKVLKAEPEVAQCVGCEDAWRVGIKNVLKSAIAVGVASAGLRKWVSDGGKGSGRDMKVEVGEGLYHAWWIIPRTVAGK